MNAIDAFRFDETSEKRLADLYPPFGLRVRDAGRLLLNEPIPIVIRVTQALRSWNNQAALWAQGREPLSAVNNLRAAVGLAMIMPAQNIEVTKAPPGYSWHNFGLAVDVAPFEGDIPDWNLKHPAWDRIVAVGRACGLVDGISWRDEPHLQWTGRFGFTPNDEVRQTFHAGGMEAVWRAAFGA